VEHPGKPAAKVTAEDIPQGYSGLHR
jgi:hypothetical protein